MNVHHPGPRPEPNRREQPEQPIQAESSTYLASKRDTYLLVVFIAAVFCSSLVFLNGIITLIQEVSSPNHMLSLSRNFTSQIYAITPIIVYIAGGSFSLYYSVQALFFKRSSRAIWLPDFWFLLLCYLLLLVLSYWLYTQNLDVTIPILTVLLIYLGAVCAAMVILALGIHYISIAESGVGPTTWQRFTLALVSGATLSASLALFLEQSFSILFGLPGSLIDYALIYPLIEELVKPLGALVLIGRVHNKAEAFILGLACGIGFDLVETTFYISSSFDDWWIVMLLRFPTALMHGFGTAMVVLGWYYLLHKAEGSWARRLLLAAGCGGYALFQHALWNFTLKAPLLPGGIGNFFQVWAWPLYIIEAVGMLIFYIFMSGQLRPVEHER